MRAACCVALSMLWACGAQTATRPEPPGVSSGTIEEWDQRGSHRPSSATLDRQADGAEPTARRPRSEAGRGGFRSHLVDVRFDDADLHNALRFLADEAGLSLVIGEGVGGRVSDRLTRVDAYEALLTLAHAHGATVERRDRVVIVRGSR